MEKKIKNRPMNRKPLPLTIRSRNQTCRILTDDTLTGLSRLTGGRRTLVLADRRVARLHRDRMPRWETIRISAGEKTKTIPEARRVYRKLMGRGLDRSGFLVGIGGGTLTDLCGFVAATYLRGIGFGFVPTTLLGAADAAIGGKNGLNFSRFKNLIGTIRQPDFVYVHPGFFATLPPVQVKNGLAEIIKHALIADPDLFEDLESRDPSFCRPETGDWAGILYRSQIIKAGIVRKDEQEKGVRRTLNFGHTLGHALERRYRLSHGEAVSMGMAAATRLSVRLSLLETDCSRRIIALLRRFRLPVDLPGGMRGMMKAIRRDKKRIGDQVQMVLLSGIGQPLIRPMSIRDLREKIDDLP